MNIEQIFEKPLKRNINGVVKAEQTDDASAYIELDEYVITRELENHLRHFFESYVPATGPCHERCNSDPHPTPEIRSRGNLLS